MNIDIFDTDNYKINILDGIGIKLSDNEYPVDRGTQDQINKNK